MKNLFTSFCLVNLVLLFCYTTPTQAQRDGYHKMLCRGGDGAFRIDDMDDVHGKAVIGLNFTPGARSAGGAGEGLEPGTCSWVDRTLSENEPHQIQFYVSAAEAQKIRDALNSPDTFWQFSVRVTNYGFFETRDHSQFLAKAGDSVKTPEVKEQEGIAGTAQQGAGVGKKAHVLGKQKPKPSDSLKNEAIRERPERTLAPFFSYNKMHAQVEPGKSAVTFSFETREPSSFFIEVSKQQPTESAAASVPPGGTLGPAFPPGAQLAAFSLPGVSPVSTDHRVTLRRANGETFEANATYHYVITAKAPDGSYWRHVGKFSVGSQTVRVVFENIRILNDSDPDIGLLIDCGEINLWFNVNYGQPGFPDTRHINMLNNNNACTNRVYNTNVEFVIENAPNILTLSVSAQDDDTFGTRFFGGGNTPPITEPSMNSDGEMNGASGTFDLSTQAKSRVRFTLVSVAPVSDAQGDLKFEVSGYIEIDR